MILGRNRTPFTTPAAASGAFRPTMPGMRFYSHFDPFALVNTRMQSMPGAYYPPAPNAIGPAPSMPAPPPPPVTPGAATSPVGPAAGMSGAFGSTGGTASHFHATPYTVMRQGLIPGVRPNASNIRMGVHRAPGWVHQSMPFQTAPLPPPPPPPPPPAAVAPAPGGVKGLLGAIFHPGYGHRRRPRRHHWWQWNPPSTQEQTVAAVAPSQPSCEWVNDYTTGIAKEICDGRVVSYRDAHGNTINPDAYGAYGQGTMSGLGFPFPGWGRRHRRHVHPGQARFRRHGF